MLFKKQFNNKPDSSRTIKYYNPEKIKNQELSTITNENPLQVKNKRELTLLIQRQQLRGEGVEIGVQFGLYSELILENSELKRLYSIDPWLEEFPQEKSEKDGANVSQEQQDYRYLSTIFRLNRFRTRSVVLRMTSEEASALFSCNQLDFIFIDGNHTYQYVKQDLELWYPKIKPGGLFSGDDYLYTPKGKSPVKDAVDEFVEANNLELYLTSEKFPRWYLIKPT
jgi:predicted O-methyltransferase YrrM